MNIKKFVFNGKTYEIRIVLYNGNFEAEVFHNGEKANRFIYSVDFQNSCVFVDGAELYDHLINLAESDIRNGAGQLN